MRDGGDSKPLPLFLLTITPLSAFENKQSAFQFLRQPSFTFLRPSDSSPNKPQEKQIKSPIGTSVPAAPAAPCRPPHRHGTEGPGAATGPSASHAPTVLARTPPVTDRPLSRWPDSKLREAEPKGSASQTRPLTPVRGDDKGCSAPASSPVQRWLCVGDGGTGSLVSSPGADRSPWAVL